MPPSSPLPRRLLPVMLALIAATGACRESPGDAAPAPSAPWRAGDDPTRPHRVVAYRVDTGTVTFSSKGRRQTVEGRADGLRGALAIDLGDVTASTGTVEVDLLRLEVGDPLDAEARELSRTAHEWLGLGALVPTPTRERRRWARLQLERFEEPSAVAPFLGKREEGDEGVTTRLRARAHGTLTIGDYRMPAWTWLELRFHYRAAPEPTVAPTRVVVESRDDLVVVLGDFDIVPRDRAGRRLPRELGLIGRSVGRRIRARAQLTASPVPGSGETTAALTP